MSIVVIAIYRRPAHGVQIPHNPTLDGCRLLSPRWLRTLTADRPERCSP
jgi:hypothetical protein